MFFGKQILLFVGIFFLVMAMNAILFICASCFESEQLYGKGYSTPSSLISTASDALVAEEGAFSMPQHILDIFDENKCWALLISNDGEVVWQYNAPEEALRSYTLADTATFAHYGYLEGKPAFTWQRDDGLFVLAFPNSSYVKSPIKYMSLETFRRIPLYTMAMLFLDALAFFLAYLILKRRVVRSIEPITEGLDNIAHGLPAQVTTRGSLRAIGESINAASTTMQQKDAARKRWVSGASHDIRTPLSISLGHAESIAENPDVPESVRLQARIIMRQNARIRDLVSDLNIASKLEYDMQPLDASPIALSHIARRVAADCINDADDDRFAFSVEVAPEAEEMLVLADERLVVRAVRNVVDNAMRHNEEGCAIVFRVAACARDLDAKGCRENVSKPSGAFATNGGFGDARCRRNEGEPLVLLTIEDNGRGMDEAAVARLNNEADSVAQTPYDEDAPLTPGGPVPPPGYSRFLAERARDCVETTPQADADGLARGDEMGAYPSLKPKEFVGFNAHGLGLSLVARIVAAHRGSVSFRASAQGGFSVTMRFPTL